MNAETVIRPELVAGKLAALDNLESPWLSADFAKEPRLTEVMWYIQWRSFQPGSVRKLVDDLLAAFPDRFITESMKTAGPPRNGRYTLAQCWQAWNGFQETRGIGELAEWLLLNYGDGPLPSNPSSDVRSGAERFNWEYLRDACHGVACAMLPEFLRSLCVDKHTSLHGPWYCPDLVEVLLAFMDQHAAQTRERLVFTEVVEKVFDAVDFAVSEKKMVRIVGNSRFGKSESLRTWAAMYPGRVRLVTVPCSNALADLVKAVAESLGLATSFGTSGQQLRTKVEFILQHGRLGILADESHFLYPLNLNKNTPAHRLNWVRTAIVDRRIPCVLCATPQDYNSQVKRFEKTTNFNMDQFLGREATICQLPDEISVKDLTACLKFHFPGLNEYTSKLVVAAAIQSHSFVQALENIAARSRWRARKRGAAMTLADLKAAIEDVTGIASVAAPAREPREPREPVAETPRPVRRTAAEVISELRPGARISRPETEADLATA